MPTKIIAKYSLFGLFGIVFFAIALAFAFPHYRVLLAQSRAEALRIESQATVDQATQLIPLLGVSGYLDFIAITRADHPQLTISRNATANDRGQIDHLARPGRP